MSIKNTSLFELRSFTPYTMDIFMAENDYQRENTVKLDAETEQLIYKYIGIIKQRIIVTFYKGKLLKIMFN